MWTSASRRPDDERGVTVVGRLVRLLDEVEEVNREIERIETKMNEAIGHTSRSLRGSATEAE